jgi:hypothetical protein
MMDAKNKTQNNESIYKNDVNPSPSNNTLSTTSSMVLAKLGNHHSLCNPALFTPSQLTPTSICHHVWDIRMA